MKVVLTWFANDDELETIRAGVPEGTELFVPAVRPHLSRFEVALRDVADAVEDADAVMGWVLPPGILERGAKLKAVVWLHAGCDELDFETLRARGIQVANARGGNAVSVAEHAVALLLGAAKRLIVKHRTMLEARWERPEHERPEFISLGLEGKTLAVIGLGLVGTAIAKRVQGFDMRVLGLRRSPEKGGDYVDAVYGPDDLNTVLGESDFVVLATPITRETVGFFDEDKFARMKPGALLVNIARGNLIDERALHAALGEGRLAGYAADVWWFYTDSLPPTYHFPVPSRTGIQHLPTVVATGDQAGTMPGVKERLVRMGTESLAAFLRGETMPRLIDLELGY